MSWITPASITGFVSIATLTENLSIDGLAKVFIDSGALGILAFLLWYDRAKTLPSLVQQHKEACVGLSCSVDNLAESVKIGNEQNHEIQKQNMALITTLIHDRNK